MRNGGFLYPGECKKELLEFIYLLNFSMNQREYQFWGGGKRASFSY